MEFILASGNKHKAEEFSLIFDPKIISVKSAPARLDVIEDGESFYANAFIKAKSYFDKFKISVLADDSGLTVESLPNELGIHSARFGGEGLSDKDRAMLLLKKMEGIENRKAFFTCVLCFYLAENEVFYFEGRMSGSVGYSYRGVDGFGYDPVFIPDEGDGELSVSEMIEWKNKNSHRAVAINLAQKFFAKRFMA